MAFNDAPSDWLPNGYSLDSNLVRFKTATGGTGVALPELTDAQADPTTGDIRQVMYAICAAFAQAWESKATADRPTRMTISRTTSTAREGVLSHSFTFRFDTPVGSTYTISSEPA